MKVAIIVFSPSGHTLKVSQLFKKGFEDKNIEVQFINITKNEKYLNNNDGSKYLEAELHEHDVILIGGPVYAGHVEKNVLRLIEQLPEVGGKYGGLAVPFVTYGGVHSSIALEEMGRYIKRKNRKSILGVKIATKHTLTETLSNVINGEKPGEVEEKIIDEAVQKIIKLTEGDHKKIKDVSRSFKYSKLPERILFNLFSQEAFHKKFKGVSIDSEKCIGCKKCVSNCPINMFDCSDGVIKMIRDKQECILCGECYHNCPVGAIDYPYIEMAKKRLNDGNIKLEEKQSAIYPMSI
jgi:ferredoxin/flavodoxin